MNFWQDLASDVAMGRVYLPDDVLKQNGLTFSALREPSACPALRGLLRQQCDLAEAHLHRGLPLAQRVPRWFASDVKLFAHGGLATIAAIRQIDYDVLKIRPKVSRWRQSGWSPKPR